MNKNFSPKIAIFYDWLNQWGGAERVLLNMLTLYPQAELFTLVHDPAKTSWLPKNIKIHTSFLNKLPFSKKNPIFYTPFYGLAIEQFDFSQYDIVISTTSTIGHGLLTPPSTLYLTYFHNLNRHVYLHQPKYLSPLLNVFILMDRIFIKRPDVYLCNSVTVKNRLKNFYKINPLIINPGVDTKKFVPIFKPSANYFLVVGRQVHHKKIDLVINYFCHHPKQRVIIAGGGRDHQKLVKLANNSKNIVFIRQPSNTKLVSLYQNCMALISPQLEDFGLTQLEAQSCGRPVIGYKKGGNLETIINNKTGILFDHQTINSIEKAIDKFEKMSFNPSDCRQQALKFSDRKFMLHFRHHLTKLWKKHQTTIF